MIRNAPLFRERPRSVQVVTGLVFPILAGAIAGALLGLNAAAYWAISVVALAGGILGGFEHADGWDGAIFLQDVKTLLEDPTTMFMEMV